MKRTLASLLTALSVSSLIWAGDAFFNKPLESAGMANVAETLAAPAVFASAKIQGVKLTPVDPVEALGLMLIGAQNTDRLASLTDSRDICTVVKANAVLQNPDLGDRRFTKEFEACTDRTLHYEAAFLHAGSVIGVANILKMAGADFCGVFRIATGRAVLTYLLESGKTLPDHDATLRAVNAQLKECVMSYGKFALPVQLWNEYAIQAIILPFYATKPPAEKPKAEPTPEPGART